MAFFGSKKDLEKIMNQNEDHHVLVNLKRRVAMLEDELKNIKELIETSIKDKEVLQGEISKRDETIGQMAAEISALRSASKEMGTTVDKQECELRKCQQEAEVVKKAVSIVEKNQDIEEKIEQATGVVNACKEEINTTFAQVLKQKGELEKKEKQVEELNIKKEVKDVIRQNAKFVKQTVDMEKSIVFFGVEQTNSNSRIDRDKMERRKIVDLLKVMTEEDDDIGIEEFQRLGKYVGNAFRPLKVTLQCSSMVETVLRNAKKIKQSDEWKHVWVNRCLTREDRDKVKEKVQEAKLKNSERSVEEENHFFYRVVGLQVRKIWYKRDRQAEETRM